MQQSTRIHSFCGLIGLAVSPLVPARAQVPTWSVSAKPITAIGSVEGGAGQELANVSGAHRLADGRVVVANGKPLELRIYSARGALLAHFGRKGSGPGEFNGRLDLLPAAGDSVLVFDQGNDRTTLFNTDGRIVREWPTSAAGSPVGQAVLFRQSFARAVVPPLTGCLHAALAALPPVAVPAFREVMPDGAGHYLVRVDGAANWIAYSSAGSAMGTFRLPPRFELYEIGKNYVVGKALLEDDIEQVQVLAIGVPAASPVREACAGRIDSFPDVSSPRATEFRAALRAALTAGEMAFSNYARYVTSIDSLPGLKEKLPAGSAFRGWRASQGGWAAAIYDRRSTLVCAFALNTARMTGWPDGRIKCSE